MITAGLVLAPWGVLPWAIALLAATAWITVVQRVLSVAQAAALSSSSPDRARERSLIALLCYHSHSMAELRSDVLVRMPPDLKQRLAARGRATAARA